MANFLKSSFRIVGTLFAVLVLAIIAFWFAVSSACNNEVLIKLASPDQKQNLFIFQRDCGATTGFSTQASILPMGKSLPNKNGNIFITDTNHDKSPSGKGSGPELSAEWRQSDVLLLQYHKKTRVFKRETNYGEVKVTYTTFN